MKSLSCPFTRNRLKPSDAHLPKSNRCSPAPRDTGHLLAQGIETPEQFNLIVRWRSLEDHSPGFEESEDHQRFMLGLEDYFSAEPKVYHIEGGAFPDGDLSVPGSSASTGSQVF